MLTLHYRNPDEALDCWCRLEAEGVPCRLHDCDVDVLDDEIPQRHPQPSAPVGADDDADASPTFAGWGTQDPQTVAERIAALPNRKAMYEWLREVVRELSYYVLANYPEPAGDELGETA